MEVGDDDLRLAELGAIVRRNDVALAVVVARVLRQQDPQAVGRCFRAVAGMNCTQKKPKAR